MFKKLLISFLIFSSFFSLQNVFAYDNKTTHPALTEEIVDFYNLSFPDKPLTPQQKEWIIEGSILEDTPPRWINHFYDPINKVGWTGKEAGKISVSFVQLFSRFALSLEKPVSAVEWVNNRLIQQEYSRYGGNRAWKKALEYFADGNQEQAYKTLGYVLHLLEDMSVPDHTRDDTHAQELSGITGDEGSPYEQYASQYTRQNIKKEFNIIDNLKKDNLSPIRKNLIEDYLISLATYSNKYFFSKDTIDGYQEPKIIRDDGEFGYGRDENREEFKLAKLVITKTKKTFLLDKSNDEIILGAYFSRLSRQSVLHGAGVINLFHKQAEDAIVNKEYPVHLVEFRVDKLIPPTLSLVGELSKAKEVVVSFFSQVKSTTNNIFSSINNLLGINQFSQQPQQIFSLNTSVIDPIFKTNSENIISPTGAKNKIIENPKIAEQQTQQIISKPKEEIKPQQIIQKTEEIIQKEQPQIIENTQPVSNKIVFKFTGGGSSGESSGGSSSGSPTPENIGASSAPIIYPKILINEIQLSSTSSVHDEFVELYNSNNESVDLTNWYVQKKTANGINFSTFATANSFNGKTIGAKGFILIAHSSSTFIYDIVENYSISDNNVLVLKNPNGEIVDKVGWGTANDCEGSPFGECASNPTDGQSAQRIFQNNEFIDTDNNAQDFEIQTCPSPNAQSASCQIAEPEPEQNNSTSTEQIIESDQTATSTESTSTVADSHIASHIVISEIYLDKTTNNFDFVELYNPTDSLIELGNYSLKIRKESATSTSSLSSFSSSHTVAAKSFFLAGLDNYGSSTNSTADILRTSYSLFTSTSSIVYLMDNDAIIDEINYNPANFANGQSLERKSFTTSTIDSMTTGEHRFSGNSYDADSADDFILRNSAEPQNSQNFPEPRNAPTIPQNFSVQYGSSTMSLDLSWQSSQDYSGETSTIAYKIIDVSNSSSTFSEINTTSTSANILINEIGRDYNFSIQAFDNEGLGSATSTTSVFVPNPNQSPFASFTYSPLNPEISQEITFDAASSTDSDGQINSYQWDFGDNATSSISAIITTHSYSTSGDYLIQLTVIDNNGASSNTTSTISIFAQNSTSTSYQQIDYTNTIINYYNNQYGRNIRQTLGSNLSGTISGASFWVNSLGESYTSDRDANFQLVECDDIDYNINCQTVIDQNFPYIRNVYFQVSIGENNLIFSTPYALNSNKFYYLQWTFPYVYQWWAWRGQISLGYSVNDNYEAGYLWSYISDRENAKPYDNNKDLYFILNFSE